MGSYFDKLSEYYRSDRAEKDKNRFEKQIKSTFISTAIIIGAVFLLIFVLVMYSLVSSLFR